MYSMYHFLGEGGVRPQSDKNHFFFEAFPKFRSECASIVEEVVKQLEGLNGMQHEKMIDNVRICLCNGLDELSTCVESEKLVKKDGGVMAHKKTF